MLSVHSTIATPPPFFECSVFSIQCSAFLGGIRMRGLRFLQELVLFSTTALERPRNNLIFQVKNLDVAFRYRPFNPFKVLQSRLPLRTLRGTLLNSIIGLCPGKRSHVETLIIDKLGFNQKYCTFALILPTKIVLCSNFHWTKFINYKCFHMRSNHQKMATSLALI